MSHFTVLVAANDDEELEQRLLPYHEYECTGIEAYIEFVPEDMDELNAKYTEHGDGQDFDEFVKDWCGARKNAEGMYGRMTNPRAKWDWWVIGGRWPNELKLKNNSGEVNTTFAGKVDWEAMRQQSTDYATERYHKWQKLPDKNSVSEKEYRQALLDSSLFWLPVDERDDLITLSQEQYVEKYGQVKALTFAFVDCEGGWNERAHMGWFGVTYDEQPDYDKIWWQFVESLPADQRVYVIDCHI
jgi:hypothetical protein